MDWRRVVDELKLRASLFHLRKWNAQAAPAQWQTAFYQLFQLLRAASWRCARPPRFTLCISTQRRCNTPRSPASAQKSSLHRQHRRRLRWKNPYSTGFPINKMQWRGMRLSDNAKLLVARCHFISTPDIIMLSSSKL